MKSSAMIPESQILSTHRFTQPNIRLWLPLIVLAELLICGLLTFPRPRPLEVVALLLVVYVAISALVSLGEITVTHKGLVIKRLLLPERFVPWEAIDRVVVFSKSPSCREARLEIASIGLREGLSPLNRLPGLAYGQGFRQTIMITPDALENYDELLGALMKRCPVIWQIPRR